MKLSLPKLHAMAAVLAVCALGVGNAHATHVEPTFLPGNPSCSDLGFADQIRFNSPSSGTYPIPGGSVTFTINNTSLGQTVDWSSTVGQNAVIIKGGPNANGYVYNPPAPEFSDTGLHAPVNPSGSYAGVSHIDFCYTDFVPFLGLEVEKTADTRYTRTWEWDIEKAVDPDEATVFYGDSHDFGFLVSVTKTGFVDSGWAVSGQISIFNPNTDLTVTVTSVQDIIQGGIAADVDCPGGLPQSLGPEQTLVCTYDADLPDASERLNVAIVAAEEVPGGEGTAPVVFGDPTTVVNDSVSIGDTLAGDLGTISDSTSFPYTMTSVCDEEAAANGDQVTLENTATIDETGQSASASATLYCRDFQVKKTAEGRFDRTYDWDPRKLVLIPEDAVPGEDCEQLTEEEFEGYGGRWACPSTTWVLGGGAALEPVYLIDLYRDDNHEADDNFVVQGQIKIKYPTALEDIFLIAIADGISFDDGSGPVNFSVDPATCAKDVGDPWTKLTCDYSQAVDATAYADGSYAGGTNEVTATRTAQCFDAEGNAKAGCSLGDVDKSATADFGFALEGTTNACVNAVDVFDVDGDLDLGEFCQSIRFLLDGFAVDYEDLLARKDENCEVEVFNLLVLTSTDSEDFWDAEALVVAFLSDECFQGCTYTQGYWKTHSLCGPAAGPNDTWDNLLIVDKDDAPFCRMRDNGQVYETFYLSGASWLDVFWTPPQGGNAYYILAHQYMAAKLNMLAGASTTAEVDAAMAFAENFFATYTPAQAGALKGGARNTVIAHAGTLDAYNNGQIGPGHCDE